MYYIGYDIGSSSIKIALLNAKKNKEVAVINEPKGEMKIEAIRTNWAEQSPDLWWEYLCSGTKRILFENKINSSQILGVGISYQMHGLVLLDKNKKVLRNAIIWCDSRAVEIGNKAAEEIGKKKYGQYLLNSPGNFTASKLKWVKENEPKIYDQVAFFMLPGDFIAFKLTGEILTTINGLSEGILWDYKKREIANWLLDHYHIETDLTPPIVENFQNQGNITSAASKATGLPERIPVNYRAGDQPNNALSLNVLRPGEIAATGGTSGVLFAVKDQARTKEFTKVNHFAHVNYTKENPSVGTLLCINGVGILYNWLKKMTGNKDYNTMNLYASEVNIGSENLVVLPFGNGSERMLNNINLGAHFCNLNLNVHSQKHLYRAALEGIAFSFVYGAEIMKQDGIKTKVIRAGNDNLFQSKIFAETISNLLEQPIEIYSTTGAIGAARAASINNGINSIESLINNLNRVEYVEPKTNNDAYNAAYQNWKKTLINKLNNNDTYRR